MPSSRLYTLLFLLLGNSLFFGCEEPVDLSVAIPEQKLVVTSIMYPGELVTVQVNSSTNLISSTSSEPVEDATVNIFAGSHLTEQLDYVPEIGAYRAATFRPNPGATYTIQVFADGYDVAVAVSSVPPAATIGGIYSSNLSRVADAGSETYYFDFGLDFDDSNETVNYYNLRLYQERRQFMVVNQDDTTYTTRSILPMDFPAADNNEWKLVANHGGILFVDNPFAAGVTIPLSSTIDPSKEKIGQVYAELRTVSPEYYLYQNSISGTSVSINGGITPANVVYNNVKNGIGNVSGYSSNSDSLSIFE